MRLRNRTLKSIVILLIVSLGGLVALQYFLLTDAIKQRQQTFRENVFTAMRAVADRLESHEAAGNVFTMVVSTTPGNPATTRMQINLDTVITRNQPCNNMVMVAGVDVRPPVSISNDTLRYNLDRDRHVLLRVYDAVGREDTVLVDAFKQAGVYTARLDNPKYTKGEYFYKLLLDSLVYMMQVVDGSPKGILPDLPGLERKRRLVGKVVENLTVSKKEPVEKRVKRAMLDSLIRVCLNEQGIVLPYVFAVTKPGIERKDSTLIFAEEPRSISDLSATEFRARLFPGDFLYDAGNQLLLFFPGQDLYIMKQVGIPLVLTIVFIGILIVCFVYAVRTIFRQKEFAVRLIDFINNMTHEFKTPISTISVAAETIMRDDVVSQKEKVLRYGTVIRDENKRMKSQVDKILQMAVLEEGDFDLSLQPVDIHEVIAGVVEPIALQVEARQGSIRYQLDAEQSLINADPVHLANIVHNVLDNALKYSPGVPEIAVATLNDGNRLLLSIADHGIGIRTADLPKVFDRYYRVPTGNRHDVKGFGLGLSYVQLMMTAHGGTAAITSQEGSGTTVSLTFPLLSDQAG